MANSRSRWATSLVRATPSEFRQTTFAGFAAARLLGRLSFDFGHNLCQRRFEALVSLEFGT